MPIASLIVSILALAATFALGWATLFRAGRLLMTRPTMLALVFEEGIPKVVMRCLLCSSGHRGLVVESMVARLRAGDDKHLLAFWGYTPDNTVPPIRGGGLRAGVDGISLYHHFVMPRGTDGVIFQPGQYEVEVSAWLLAGKAELSLGTFPLQVTAEMANALNARDSGVMFNWNPTLGTYEGEIQHRPHASPHIRLRNA